MSRIISQTIYCTTREAAEMLGVSLRTVQLWAESGLVEAWKTAGGHRRISRSSVQRLLVEEGVREAPVAQSAFARLKVLLVEDDATLLKLYRAVFARWDLPIDVVVASNGVEGLIRVGRDSPDLLITDLQMPGMDGFQFIRSLSHSSYREGMAIVVVSGLSMAEIAEQGGLPPDIPIFAKPVNFPYLRAIVASMLEHRASYL